MSRANERGEKSRSRSLMQAVVVATTTIKQASKVRSGTIQIKAIQVLQLVNMAMKSPARTQLELSSPHSAFGLGVCI